MSRDVSQQQNNLRPSIFVLWAEDNLNYSLRRAIRFLVKFLSANYPQRFLKFDDTNFDEFYLLFDLILQWSHLTRWQASFTERFFSIQRISLTSFSTTNLKLKKSDILKSLIQLCLVPYTIQKLERYYENIRERYLMNCNQHSSTQVFPFNKLDYFVLKFYPMIRKLCQLSQVLIWISYVAGNNHSHSLLLQLFWFGKLQLSHSDSNLDLDEEPIKNFWSKISHSLSSIFDLTFQSSAFLIQFFEYWNSHTDLRRIFQQSTKISLPPPLTFSSNKPYSNCHKSLVCPICHQKRQNETALASSGYVFCYTCIHGYLKQYQRCPITGFPSKLEQLIRVFG